MPASEAFPGTLIIFRRCPTSGCPNTTPIELNLVETSESFFDGTTSTGYCHMALTARQFGIAAIVQMSRRAMSHHPAGVPAESKSVRRTSTSRV